MGLIKCPVCGKDVSDMAGSCPNCGFPINPQNGGGNQNINSNQNVWQQPVNQQAQNVWQQPVNQQQYQQAQNFGQQPVNNQTTNNEPEKKTSGCGTTLLGFLFLIFVFWLWWHRTGILVGLGLKHITMPDVSGLSYYSAEDKIEDIVGENGICYEVEEYSSEVAEGDVIRTSPSAGSDITSIGVIKIFVSKGEEPQIVPNFIGEQAEYAKQYFESRGCTVYVIEEYSDLEKGTVISTDPAFGETLGSHVDMRVSRGTVQQEIDDMKSSAKSVSYEDLARYPDSYQTIPIKITATVTELEAETIFGLEYDTSIWATMDGGNVLILYDEREVKEPALQVGDTVTVYGYSDGLATIKVKQRDYQGSLVFGFSYDKTVDRYKVPSVNIKYVEF